MTPWARRRTRIAFSSVPVSCARRASRETHALEAAQALAVQRLESGLADLGFGRDQFFDLVEEPWIDERQRMHVLDRHAGTEGIAQIEHALWAGFLDFALERGDIVVAGEIEPGRIETDFAGFQAAQGFLQRLLEGAANRHHLATDFICVVRRASAAGTSRRQSAGSW